MARYTVHLLKLAPTPQAALEGAVFIREGWSWGAFGFGPLWLLWHRHWLFGFVMLILYLLLGAALLALPLHPPAAGAAQVLIALLFGFEGAALRRFALARAGYTEVALVAGAERDEMERRFFAAHAPQPRPAPVTPPIAPSGVAPARRGGIIGSFPMRGTK